MILSLWHGVTMKKAYPFIVALLILFAGCSGKDAVRLSEDAETSNRALATVDIIKEAYSSKDREKIRENVEPALSDEMLGEFTFDAAELSITPRMIRISTSQVMVHLNWQGTWFGAGDKLRDRGTAILVFNRDTMRLQQVDGDNLFRKPAFVKP